MPKLQVRCSPVGSAAHQLDVEQLRTRGIALPDSYVNAEWPDTWWCGIFESSVLLSGFALERSHSRLLPGTSLLRVSRFGRALHWPIVDAMDVIVPRVLANFPLVLRLDVAVFDEASDRRARFAQALQGARFESVAPRSYTHTLRMDLSGDEAAVLARCSSSTRRNIRESLKAGLSVVPLEQEQLLPAMARLYSETFLRTGAKPPPLDLGRIVAAARSGNSALFGVFAGGAEHEAGALVGFAWVRSNGDHAVYDVAASVRRPELGRTPIGYPLLWECLKWAQRKGLDWMDLGGVPGPSVAMGSPLHAIASFKRGFSDDEIEVGQELRLEPNRTLSGIARRARRLLSRF